MKLCTKVILRKMSCLLLFNVSLRGSNEVLLALRSKLKLFFFVNYPFSGIEFSP